MRHFQRWNNCRELRAQARSTIRCRIGSRAFRVPSARREISHRCIGVSFALRPCCVVIARLAWLWWPNPRGAGSPRRSCSALRSRVDFELPMESAGLPQCPQSECPPASGAAHGGRLPICCRYPAEQARPRSPARPNGHLPSTCARSTEHRPLKCPPCWRLPEPGFPRDSVQYRRPLHSDAGATRSPGPQSSCHIVPHQSRFVA